MALVINDRVKETTTTTGTGAVSLGGAVTGFETFAAGIGNSNTVYYCIAHQDQAEFEVGLGTLDSDSSDLQEQRLYLVLTVIALLILVLVQKMYFVQYQLVN